MEAYHIETLGERIRKFRKEQKLTLAALAGKELTKGMLSLIENNKANPSMESLNYIAEQLGIEVSELLEEVNTKELRDILEKAEHLYHTDSDESTDKYEQLIKLIQPYTSKLTSSYESARLLEIYSKSMYWRKDKNWKTPFNRAANMYKQMNLTTRRVEMSIFYSIRKFIQHEYDDSLRILLDERAKFKLENVFIDPMSRIDLDYHEAILHFAVGDYDSAVIVMNEAIDFSKNNRLFYNIDHLYKLAVAHAMMENDEDKTNFYLNKLIQYSTFADDQESLFFAQFAEVHYLNSFKNNYRDALLLLDQYINKFIDDFEQNNPFHGFLYLEKGKSLYGLKRFDEALHFLNKAITPDFLHHPLDMSMFYERDTYAALCYLELGNLKQALKSAQKALDNISPLPHTPYKDFINDTYEKVHSKQ